MFADKLQSTGTRGQVHIAWRNLRRATKTEHKFKFTEQENENIEETISILGSMVTRPTCSQIHARMLQDEVDLELRGVLHLKSDFHERLDRTCLMGKNELWSSENLHRHLGVMRNLIPKLHHIWHPATPINQKARRPRIEAFFFRASAMLQEGRNRRMVFTVEDVESSAFNVGPRWPCLIDYTVRLEDNEKTGSSANIPSELVPGFLVVECKSFDVTDNINQTIFRVYKCIGILRAKILRAALTNGSQWVFILMKSNDNDDGASYMYSRVIELYPVPGAYPPTSWPDVIAAVLSYWIDKCFSDFDGSDDWFELEEPSVAILSLCHFRTRVP